MNKFPATSNHLTSNEAADHIGISRATLRNWRCTRRYEIPHYKIGSKVVYQASDLDAWLESRRVSPTA